MIRSSPTSSHLQFPPRTFIRVRLPMVLMLKIIANEDAMAIHLGAKRAVSRG